MRGDWPADWGSVSLQLCCLQMVALWGTLVACGGSGYWQREGGSAQSKVEGSPRVGGEQNLPGGTSQISGVGGRREERTHSKFWGEQDSVLAGEGMCVCVGVDIRWGGERGDGSSLLAEKGHFLEDQGWELPSSSSAHPLHRWETEA